MSAYTGQMERHLNKIDQIQQELYYLANKSAISSSITSNKNTLQVEQLLKNAHALDDNFSLIYIDIENLESFKTRFGSTFITDIKNKLQNKVLSLVSNSDIVSTINQDVLYVALPQRDNVSIRQLIDKIILYFNDNGLQVNGQQIDINICISVTTLQPGDTGIRALHVRADKGLMKAKAMGGQQIVFVDM